MAQLYLSDAVQHQSPEESGLLWILPNPLAARVGTRLPQQTTPGWGHPKKGRQILQTPYHDTRGPVQYVLHRREPNTRPPIGRRHEGQSQCTKNLKHQEQCTHHELRPTVTHKCFHPLETLSCDFMPCKVHPQGWVVVFPCPSTSLPRSVEASALKCRTQHASQQAMHLQLHHVEDARRQLFPICQMMAQVAVEITICSKQHRLQRTATARDPGSCCCCTPQNDTHPQMLQNESLLNRSCNRRTHPKPEQYMFFARAPSKDIGTCTWVQGTRTVYATGTLKTRKEYTPPRCLAANGDH